MPHTRSFGPAARLFASIIATIVTLLVEPVSAHAAARTSSCDGIAGQWTITNVTSFRMTINRDGVGSFHTGITFKGTCHGNSFVYTDSMGFTTRMTISRDRMHMTGAGAMGETMTAVRNSSLTAAKTAPSPSRGELAAGAATKHKSTSAGSSTTKLCAENWPRYLAGVKALADELDETLSPEEIEQDRRGFLAECGKNGLSTDMMTVINNGQ